MLNAVVISCLLQAASPPPPTAEAEQLGRRFVAAGGLATMVPLIIEKDLTELVADRPALSAAERARLIEIGGAEGRRNTDSLRVPRQLNQVATSDAIATPVYVLGLDELARGAIVHGAKLALWSHILPTEAGPVSAEVTASTAKFAQMTDSRATARFRTRLTAMAAADEEKEDFQIAQLRISALHLTFLWLKSAGGHDRFEPAQVTGDAVRVGQRYSET